MNRYTTKTNNINRPYRIAYHDSLTSKTYLVYSNYPFVKKLGQLEDIEEELGIDLITLFDKIMKAQKIYFKKKEYRKGKISYSKSFQLVTGLDKKIRLVCYCFDQCYFENKGCEFGIILELKDYGVTWALTKEELKLL